MIEEGFDLTLREMSSYLDDLEAIDCLRLLAHLTGSVIGCLSQKEDDRAEALSVFVRMVARVAAGENVG